MSCEIQQRLQSLVSAAGRKEIGGVLMAEQIEPGYFRLADFTLDTKTGSAVHFVRSVKDHQTALTEFFARTCSDYGRFNYLGEWHSHPNHHPLPSGEDIRSMESLVNGERDIPFAILLIVQAVTRGLACSATLFQRGSHPESVSIEHG